MTEMLNLIVTMLIALMRKVFFIALLMGTFKVIDNYYFKAFDTDVEVGKDPIAIAIIVAGVAIALAFA